MAPQIRHAADIRPARNQDDGRRTLAVQTPKCALPLAGNSFGSVDAWTPFSDGDVKTRVSVESLFKCLVIAGKLKLMLPFELQGHCVQRGSWMRCRQNQG